VLQDSPELTPEQHAAMQTEVDEVLCYAYGSTERLPGLMVACVWDGVVRMVSTFSVICFGGGKMQYLELHCICPIGTMCTLIQRARPCNSYAGRCVRMAWGTTLLISHYVIV
jgi:hypothetical protein